MRGRGFGLQQVVLMKEGRKRTKSDRGKPDSAVDFEGKAQARGLTSASLED